MANPNGVAIDRIRRCYAAWMRVPDHLNPIRVRWYRVPEIAAGVPQTTRYGSSDFDLTPDVSPEFGEQGGLRDPFNDWRDCGGPPWPDPPLLVAPNALGPQWIVYPVPALTLTGPSVGQLDVSAAEMIHAVDDTWRSPGEDIAGRVVTWSMTFMPDGGVTLTAVVTVATVPVAFATWVAIPLVDPFGPIRFEYDPSQSAGLTGKPFITLRPGDNDMPIIGELRHFAFLEPPPRWLACDGQAISRVTYHLLFDAIGTNYGPGDGAFTFNIPDTRDRVLIDDSPGLLDVDRPSVRNLGDAGGTEDHVLIKAEMPTHQHTVTDPGHTHTGTVPSALVVGSLHGTAKSGLSVPSGTIPVTNASSTANVTTEDEGGGMAHNNESPYIVTNTCIYAGA